MTSTPTDRVTIPVTATIKSRTVYGQHGLGKRKVHDAKVGQVEVTADTKPAVVSALARGLKALAMQPTIPIYRQHRDGRGAIIHITGCDDAGILQVAIDLLKPEGGPAGAYLFALEKRDSTPGSRTITIESDKWDVERALRLELEHYLRSIDGIA